MATPKPMAPSKPLSFRPPEKPEARKKSKTYKNKQGDKPQVVLVDEVSRHPEEFFAHAEALGEGMVLEMVIDAIGTPSEPKKAEKPKKPFVLDPHLTQRPFHDDRLMQLKAQLQRPSSKNR